MKIRTDFVTNSSSSSYVTFRIENKLLASLFLKMGLYRFIDFNAAQKNIVCGEFSFEDRSSAEIPGRDPLSFWLLDQIEKSMPYLYDEKDAFEELTKLIKENAGEIDRSTKRATFSCRGIVTDDWGSSFSHQENKGGKIYYVGFDEDDWNKADLTKKTGEQIYEFLASRDEVIVRLAKEKFETSVDDDPYYANKDDSVFDDPAGLSFDGQVVCLTGDFDYGSKADVTAFITAHGGSCSSSVTAKTTIVLAGNKGSENWAYGNYGTKVAKAIEKKKQGVNIRIIKEDKELFNS